MFKFVWVVVLCMEIAVISDVHGNLPALEAVKDEVESRNPEMVVCLGDVIGYNPWPAECVDVVRDWCDVVLQGNHDRDVADPSVYRQNEMAYEGLLWAEEELSDEQFSWVQELPEKAELNLEDDGSYLIVHSHPEETDKYVRPRDFARMRPLLDDELGCWLGHTHIQHKATIDGRLILNPGSVGQPRDDDKRAAFAIVDTETNEAELCRVSYDVDRVINRVEEVGLPRRTGTRLL